MFDIVAGGRAQEAFDLSQEPQKVRDRFGEHDWAKQALLACRLVECGSSFVTINLRNHSASTICHHMGVSLDATYNDYQCRPNFIVDQGAPLREFV